MHDIKIVLGRPYRGSTDAANVSGYQVTFEGTFDEQILAFKFVRELNELCAKYVEAKEGE